MQKMTPLNNQRGSTLIELLTAMVLFSIVALGLARSVGLSNRVQEKTDNNSIAMQIALETLEAYSVMDPLTLGTTNTNNDMSRGTSQFNQNIIITVNSDNSRTVQVTVTDKNAAVQSRASIKGTFTSQSSM